MRTTLVLLTERYPYLPGEQFIETELQFLAQAFERVVVLPLGAGEGARSLPANVTLDRGLIEGPAAPVALVRDMTALVVRELWQGPRYARTVTGLKRAARLAQGAARVAAWVERAGPPPATTMFYAYWMMQAAVGLALAQRRRPALAFVTRAHGWDLYEDQAFTPPYIPFRRPVLEAARAVYPVSDHGRAHLAARFPRFSDKIITARLGVPAPPAPGGGSRDGVFRLLSCSALTPVKRLDRMVEGIAAFAAARPGQPVDWTHFGGGEQQADLTRRCGAALPGNVRWTLRGQQANAEVQRHYRQHPVDVFLNTSDSEGVPVSIMEALSYGTPVVATAVGGVPELVGPANGVLLPGGASPGQVAAALTQLLGASPGDLARKRAASLAVWRERADAQAHYGGFARRLAAWPAGGAAG